MNYETVPNIISGKDLEYLSDLFNWNIGTYKKTQNCAEQIQNEEIKSMVLKASEVFRSNVITVLNIIEQGGQNGQQ